MATITINDQLGVSLLTSAAGPGSGIAKYFKGQTAAFVASAELAREFAKPVRSLKADPLGLALNFAADGTFGNSGVDWMFAAGASVFVQAAQEGKPVPGDGMFGHPITVGAGKTLVATTFSPTLSVGLSHGISDLQFGFSAGGSVAFRAGRMFDVAASPGLTLADAVQSLLSTAVVPANVLDLATMEEGDIASVSGSGNLKFSASFDVAQVFNPAASVNLPLKQLGKVSLQVGASLKVSAGVSLSGSYQIRVQKLADRKVRLGYYKLNDSQFQFGVAASLGISATAGRIDVVKQLMGMLGAPEASEASVVEAGLGEAQIASLQAAVEASLNRSLAVSLAGSFATTNTRSRMFEYEFDLGAMGSEGVAALDEALQGDLSGLTAGALPSGVRLLSSELDEVKKKKVTWKINFLGIINVLKVSELIVHGHTLFNADTGELVVTDEVTAKKLTVVTRPLEADPKKLHKMLLQSLMITAAYRASGTQVLAGNLSGSMSYFEQVASANRTKVSDFLDNFVGLELMTAAEKTAFLTGAFSGRASVFLDAAFTDADFTTMFFDGGGQPRAQEHYELIGRTAVANLIQPRDEHDFRRKPMIAGDAASDKLWNQMSAAGQPSFPVVLPAALNHGVRLAMITHDYTVIKWWAKSMAKAAKAVGRMKALIASTGKTAEQLQSDKKFKDLRDELNEALKDVASDALPDFLDAWGVLAMDAAAARGAALTGILVTAGAILTRQRA
jgi:hypothetical protein